MPSAARATPVRVRRIAKGLSSRKKSKQDAASLRRLMTLPRQFCDSNKSALGVSKFAADRANRDPPKCSEVLHLFGCPLATRASLFRASRVEPLSGRPPERWDTRAGAETRAFVS
jgi:hypothetical protein